MGLVGVGEGTVGEGGDWGGVKVVGMDCEGEGGRKSGRGCVEGRE